MLAESHALSVGPSLLTHTLYTSYTYHPIDAPTFLHKLAWLYLSYVFSPFLSPFHRNNRVNSSQKILLDRRFHP